MSKLEEIPTNIMIGDKSILIGMSISLKRIADALEKLTKLPVMYASKEDAEEWDKANKNMGFTEYKR